MSKRQRVAIRKATGRPCPRVELELGNVDLVALLPYVTREDLRPLAPMALRSLMRSRPPAAADALLSLLPRVTGDLKVRRQLYLSKDELRKQEQEEAKKGGAR